ncbi:MAG: hypothetical protein MZU91_12930 [Desulfosudis oleivorans]|nr:hypothetical protein [Desulfosudis oleivorans]
MRQLTVWEHERIAVVDNASATERALTRAEADALAAVTEGLDEAPDDPRPSLWSSSAATAACCGRAACRSRCCPRWPTTLRSTVAYCCACVGGSVGLPPRARRGTEGCAAVSTRRRRR